MPLHMRLPKLKGFKNPNKVEFQVVNLAKLARAVPRRRRGRRRRARGRGRGPQGPAGQGARHRRDHVGPGHRARVLRDRQGARSPRPAARPPSSLTAPTRSRGVPGVVTTSPGRPSRRLLGSGSRSGPAPARWRPRPRHRRGPFVSTGAPSGVHQEGLVLSAFASAFRTPDLRKKLLFTLGIIALFRLGSVVPTPGVDYTAIQTLHRRRPGQLALRPDQPVQRRGAAAAVGLRARDHAVHHGEHHHPAAHRGDPAPGVAASRRARPARPSSRSTPATSRSASRSCSRPASSRSPAVPGRLFQGCKETLAPEPVDRHDPDDDHHDDRRHRRHHVARRADHRPRHRQRHVAADLHLDHRRRSPASSGRSAITAAASPGCSCSPSASPSSPPWSYVEQAQRRIPVQYAKRMVGRKMYGGTSPTSR